MPGSEGRPKVLMVDDDEDFQDIVRGWISPWYDHLSLPNGEELLEKIEDTQPNLVIMDVRMPGPDGFKLCSKMRSDKRYAWIPILFLTGCKTDEDFIRNLDCGGTAFLNKPVGRKRLLSMLRELINE